MSRFPLILTVFIYMKMQMIVPNLANPTNQDFDDTCPVAMADAGLNATTFKEAVSHGIHSITVEDLRYYFDESVPNENNIPTVNLNLTGSHVLTSTPFGGSEFQTPAMRMMDLILSRDDGKDNFMIRGATRMEKIAHGVHMLELWHKTSKVYEKIKENPPKDEVCSCATDETNNGILEELREISIYLRNVDGSEEDMNTNLIEDDLDSNRVGDNAARLKRSPARRCFKYKRYGTSRCKIVIRERRSTDNISVEDTDEMPELKDIKSWGVWKAMLKYSMLDDNEIYHLAMYLYCKISARED